MAFEGPIPRQKAKSGPRETLNEEGRLSISAQPACPPGFHEYHSWVSETPKKGRAAYARRKAIALPVFGQIHTRQGKFVLLRGLEQAAHEWDLIAACHNLMKLHTVHTKALLATQAALTARPAT
ncbi:transposase [Cryobacterium sp. TMT2-42-4]|uniref:transposase n=1 Tax=Cryobacterium sp. TMT2-42-4 TaxID=1259255 RepID=UPI0024118049|nr:transposase [Cryobacterium sp. TMT2-42-4]